MKSILDNQSIAQGLVKKCDEMAKKSNEMIKDDEMITNNKNFTYLIYEKIKNWNK